MKRRLLSLVLGLSLTTVPAMAQPTFPGDNGLLAFVTNASSSPELWMAQSNGSSASKVDNLTSPVSGAFCAGGGSGTSSGPAWSPDGSTIAYANNGYVWTVSVGEAPTQLTEAQARRIGPPAWSFDGSRIAVILDFVLTVIDVDSGTITEIEAPDPNWFDDFVTPSWSPDGTAIAAGYTSARISMDVVVVAADGSVQNRITSDGVSRQPAWSPRGEVIAFASNGGINTMQPDGSQRSVIANTGPNGSLPRWSPDGTRLLFSRYNGASFTNEAYVVDGDTVQPIPAPPGDWVCDPVWSPDGRQVVFYDLDLGLWTIDSFMSGPANPIGISGQQVSWGSHPEEAVDIGTLIDDIDNLDIKKGKKNSLLSTLRKAGDLLVDSNADNDGAVCDKLIAFEGKVADLGVDGVLTEEEAGRLVTDAQTIRGDIGCTY